MNLVEGMDIELKRARELLIAYKTLPRISGFFGIAVIEQAIRHAESSMETLDPVDMLNAYEELRKLE